MLRHAGADAIHIRDIGAAQPLSIAFAGGALLGSALRSRRLRHHYKPEQRSNAEDPGAMQPGGTFHGRFSLCGSPVGAVHDGPPLLKSARILSSNCNFISYGDHAITTKGASVALGAT